MHSERMALVGLLILHGFTGVASCIQISYTSQLSPHNHTSISMDILSPVGNEGKKHRQIPLSAFFVVIHIGWNCWAAAELLLN
jgi:hypothetical protein